MISTMEVIYQVDIISDEFWDYHGWDEREGPLPCFKTREGALAWAQDYLDECFENEVLEPDTTLEQFAEVLEVGLSDTL